ncbi:MAG: lamin tail domain-containing protein [Candidatus Undinarchaeales archaeon]
MEIQKYLIVLSLVSVLLVAGCTGTTPEGTDGMESQEETEMGEETEGTETETEAGTETEGLVCTVNEDCDDGDDCTMDSCVDGVCEHIPNYNCESKDYMEPSITEVSFTGEEYVKVGAKNWDVEGWTIENGNGTEFYKFPEKYTLNRYVIIYSTSDLSTTTKKYAAVGEDFWSDDGDKAILKDASGKVISEMSE